MTTAQASILLNGSPMDQFRLEKGIHQGDPVSPFLFLLVAEGISLMLKKGIANGLSKPIFVERDKVEISHLQFADNTIFVGEASSQNILFIKHFLVNLELILGLKVNSDKSSICGLNLEENRITNFASWLGYSVGLILFKYLGVIVESSHRKIVE